MSKLHLTCFIILGVCAMANGSVGGLAQYFNTLNDGSRITWAHGVNSREELIAALHSDVMMLETDISLGIVDGDNSSEIIKQPIMAHPPLNTSDINLNDWLDMVIDYPSKYKKGIKLDFKFDEVLEPSFKILQSKRSKIDFPLVINADIQSGPINPTAKPVNASMFLNLCRQYFPSSIISPGWTTSMVWNESTSHLEAYSWRHVVDMVLELRKANISQPVTFPIRATFIAKSLETLVWLVNVVPNSSLTVWMGILDSVNITDLILLRHLLPLDVVYFDLPSEADLVAIRGNHQEYIRDYDNLPTVSQCGNVLQMPYFSSDDRTIAGSTAMVMIGSSFATFKFPVSSIAEQNGFVLRGIIEFLAEEARQRSSTSMVVISFGQNISQMHIYPDGLVEVFSEAFGWKQMRETGSTYGFEMSVPDVEDEDNLEVVIRLYPHRHFDALSHHDEAIPHHEYRLQRMKGSDIIFQIITTGEDAKVFRQLQTSCLQTTNRAVNYYSCGWFYLLCIIMLISKLIQD